MLKRIILSLSLSLSLMSSSFACSLAADTNDPNFCESFKSVAECHCSEVLPHFMCKNMEKLYKRMLRIYGTLENTCMHQSDTPVQTCIDDWNCYRNGGKDSLGRSCSGTGVRCE